MKRFQLPMPLIPILLALALCFSVAYCAPAHAADASALLSWSAPTTRVDGTPLTRSEIAEYRIYYVIDAAPPTVTGANFTSVTSEGTTITLQLTPRAQPYTVHFAATAVDTAGRESPLSPVVSKQFLVESTSKPGAPTSVKFEISCGDGCAIKAAN